MSFREPLRVKSEQRIQWSVLQQRHRVALMSIVHESTRYTKERQVEIVSKVFFKQWMRPAPPSTRFVCFLTKSSECLASLHMIRRDERLEFYVSGLQNTITSHTNVYRLCNGKEKTYFRGLAALLLRRALHKFSKRLKFGKLYAVRLVALGSHALSAKTSNDSLVRYYQSLGFFISDRARRDDDEYALDDGTPMHAIVQQII